jgi:Flp pilus assembly pilin Flp
MQSIIEAANDKSLELAVRTQFAVDGAAERLAERMRDDEGQTAIEYAGILAFVGVIFAALFKAHVVSAVTHWASQVVSKINAGV